MDTESLIRHVYSAFNRRDVDEVLAFMSDDVSWPRASESGRAIGKQEIREYWSRQWKEFDPHVDPIEVLRDERGKTRVRVHQLVKNLNGDVFFDGEVWHVYAIANGLIARMDIGENPADAQQAANAAFSRNE
jgi:hypothetical protein